MTIQFRVIGGKNHYYMVINGLHVPVSTQDIAKINLKINKKVS